jgi:hypothetical protein
MFTSMLFHIALNDNIITGHVSRSVWIEAAMVYFSKLIEINLKNVN